MALRLTRLIPSLRNNFNKSDVLQRSNNSGLTPNNGFTNIRSFCLSIPLLKKEKVNIILVKDGQEIHTKGKEGDSIHDVIVKNEIDIPGYGACEGTLSCSTCHVKLSPEDFNKIPDKASDEELDMLDLAPDVCSTSRLGCQVFLTKSMEGIRVQVPSVVKDLREYPGSTSMQS